MIKKMAKATLIATVSFVTGMNIYNSQKADEEMSEIALANVEALADDETDSVTCVYDEGDVCIVGNTRVPNYDEGCSSWFWG